MNKLTQTFVKVTRLTQDIPRPAELRTAASDPGGPPWGHVCLVITHTHRNLKCKKDPRLTPAIPKKPRNGNTPQMTPRTTAMICRNQITSKNSSCRKNRECMYYLEGAPQESLLYQVRNKIFSSKLIFQRNLPL